MVGHLLLSCMLRLAYALSFVFITTVFSRNAGFNFFYSLLLLRTPVSARSYRASVFLLDYVLCCHCQANKLIHSFIQTAKCDFTRKKVVLSPTPWRAWGQIKMIVLGTLGLLK